MNRVFPISPLLLLGAGACVTVQPPPCSATSEWGIARASTPDSAARLSAHLSEVAPRIVAAVPGLSLTRVDARFVEGIHTGNFSSEIAPFVVGAAIHTAHGRWIELPEDADPVREKRILAHELVHTWLGPDWDPLPHFLEEGLADWVKDSAVPEGYAADHVNLVLMLSTALFGGLILDSTGAPLRCGSGSWKVESAESLHMALLPFDRRRLPTVTETLAFGDDAQASVREPYAYYTLTCYGYLIASRIGVRRLHGLCLRARSNGRRFIPPEWALESAGLPVEDEEAWCRAILALYGPAEQRAEREQSEAIRKTKPLRMPPPSVPSAP